MLLGLAAIALSAMLAACSIFEAEWVSSTFEGRAFRHPPSWQVQLPREPLFGAPHFRQLFYVANVTIGPECVEIRANDFDCGDAIPPLENGDVVIAWAVAIGFGGGRLGAAANLIIDGNEASLEVADEPTEYCRGADFAASLDILTSDNSNETIFYCSRGATEQEALRAFELFIDSVDLGELGRG